MSASDLETRIRAAVGQDKSLILTGTLVGSTDIGTLLAKYFTDGKVAIADADAKLSGEGSSVLLGGKVDYQQLTGCTLSATLTPGDGNSISLDLRIALADGWTMRQVFPSLADPTLKGLSISGASLVVASAKTPYPAFDVDLAAGMSLIGTLNILKSVASIASLLGEATLPIYGSIEDPALPLFTLRTKGTSATLVSTTITGCFLSFAAIDLAKQKPADGGQQGDADSQPISYAETSIQGTLSLGPSASAVIRAALESDSGSLSLTAEFVQTHMSDFAKLVPFIGGDVDPWAALPLEIKSAVDKVNNAFTLKRLGLTYNIKSNKFSTADIVVGIDLNGFGLFDAIPVLSIKDLEIGWTISKRSTKTAVAFRASADISIDSKYDVLVAFQTQPNNGYTISISQDSGTPLALGDLVTTFLPGMDFLPKFTVAGFSILLAPRQKQYSFMAEITGSWDVLSAIGISLTEIDVSAFYDGALTPAMSGSIQAAFKLGLTRSGKDYDVDFALKAERQSGASGWYFEASTGTDQVIPIGDLVAGLIKKFEVSGTVPEAINDVTLENLFFSYDTEKKKIVFTGQSQFTIKDQQVYIAISIDVNRSEKMLDFGGVIRIGQFEFDLFFEKADGDSGATSNLLLAAFKPGVKINMRSLVANIDVEASKLVPEIELGLENVLFAYRQKGKDSDILFGLALGLDLDLSSLPLVGKIFADSKLGGIKDVQALYTANPLSADDVTAFNGLLGKAQVKPPLPIKQGAKGTAAALTKGFNFAANVTLGGDPVPLSAGGGSARVAADPPEVSSPPLVPTGNATWIDVKKSIGPVTLERVGVRYEDGRVWLLLDADFMLACLSMGLQGLALGFKLNDLKDITANLDGMSLSFQSGPLEIAGGFLRINDDYLGEAIVKAATFSLTAIGGYAPKERSFFIFVRLDVPLGGPPFFFVTGLAGGFGINRTLRLPAIDELPGFALLPQNSKFPKTLDAKNPGSSLASTLATTEGFIKPFAGANWVAAGLDFTSFEMVDSSALVTVSFGVKLEIALLGICRVTVPKGAPDPIVYLEIALEARFDPDQGLIAVDGRLTPASYIYAGLCRVTGGFAFYIWFAGPHEGDFVVSIGGYHPRFKKPDNYPAVPRLQMIYRIGALVIKGQCYLALTPHMVMAGIQIDATWESGSISAWFSAGMDFLLGWKPFHYEADAFIHIGVSFTLDLLFTSVSITIHVGVDLNIWGPPFGGKATIDLDIISFTIYFGDDQKHEVLDWAGFKSSFLPAAKSAPAPHANARVAAFAVEPSSPDSLLCTASVTEGLIKELKAKDSKEFFSWLVDPNHFAIASSTLIPVKQVDYNDFTLQKPFNDSAGLKYKGSGAPTTIPSAKYDKTRYPNGVSWTDQIGVLPMQLAPEKFTSAHTVQIKKLPEGGDYTVAGNYTDNVDNISLEPLLKGAQSAMWAGKDPGLNGQRLIDGTLVGLRLSPMIQHPDITAMADLWAMLFDGTQQITWYLSTPVVARDDKFDARVSDDGTSLSFRTSGRTLQCDSFKLTALADNDTDGARAALVKSLNNLGFAFAQDAVDVADLAKYPLWDWPMVRSLGEEVAA